MTLFLESSQQEKVLTAPAKRLLKALSLHGEGRIVGGALRDVLLGNKVGDIDIATTLTPAQVMETLSAEDIKTVPTGIVHGTVTAVIDHKGYEITTLRQDVKTDGRHAEVTFTDDWKVDAARRDFTINALYLNGNGELFDYFDGKADASKGVVRFIGDAGARIHEDILRILRFFRFYAWFGQGPADQEGLKACRDLADQIPRLSAERVAREILKLLSAKNPLPSWRLMIESGVTHYVAAPASDLPRLELLLRHEKTHALSPSPLLRLAALIPQDEVTAAEIATHLKFSRSDSETLSSLAKLPKMLIHAADPLALRRVLYHHGSQNCKAALFLLDQNIEKALATVAAWEDPHFPLKGEDLIALGYTPGPDMGEVLRTLEAFWIRSDFKLSKDTCLQEAKRLKNI